MVRLGVRGGGETWWIAKGILGQAGHRSSEWGSHGDHGAPVLAEEGEVEHVCRVGCEVEMLNQEEVEG